jgi:hypothetical protein
MRLMAAAFGTGTGVECRPDDGSRDVLAQAAAALACG